MIIGLFLMVAFIFALIMALNEIKGINDETKSDN